MKHYLFNPTWRCPSNCPECWVRSTILLDRRTLSQGEHSLEEWLPVFQHDPPDVLDIAGGEPFILPGLCQFVAQLRPIKVGLSTNGLYRESMIELRNAKLDNVISINLSFHPNIAAWHTTYLDWYKYILLELRQVRYSIFPSIVNYQDNLDAITRLGLESWFASNGFRYVTAPFEDMNMIQMYSNILGIEKLSCHGGNSHKVFAPNGDVFPCLTALRSPHRGRLALGNVFAPNYSPAQTQPIQECRLYCYDYYVLSKQHPSGDMWGVGAQPATIAESRTTPCAS